MKAVSGPYKFGDQAPTHLMGWLPDEVKAASADCAKFCTPFTIQGHTSPEPPPPIWTLTKTINNGQHLPTFEQAIGDCVAAGLRQAGMRLQVADIVARYQEELLKPWYVPYIYGISRVQIGGGQLNGDGSTGAWGAAAVAQYGVLFDDDDEVPAYSGGTSRAWGRPPGPPAQHLQTAKPRLCKSMARLTTINQIREALCNYHPCTIASSRGFKMQPENRLGFHAFVPSGSWAHQMCLLAWMDDPFPAAYRLNSWGNDAHGTPLNNEPPGGAWCTAECIIKELKDIHTEIYTYSTFNGFPAAPNRGLIN